MLDLTVIFLVAGFLLDKSLFDTSQGKQEPPADWKHNGLGDSLAASSFAAKSQQTHMQPSERLQWILGWLFFLLGIVYAIGFVATNPFYEKISFGTSRLMLVKLLPAIACGFLAGVIVRTGLRMMNPFFVAMGAVFFVLPFLVLNGPDMLDKLKKFKIGSFFEAEINSTEKKTQVQQQIESLFDPSVRSNLSALNKSDIDKFAYTDEMVEELCHHLSCGTNEETRSVLIASRSEEADSPGPSIMNASGFYRTYIEQLVSRIVDIDDGSLSRDRTIRETLHPVANAGENLLQSARSSEADRRWPEAWCGFLNQLQHAESDLDNLRNIGETNISLPTNGIQGCDGATVANPKAIPTREFTTTLLPHILIARLYRRAGFDARALKVLERTDELAHAARTEPSTIDSPAKANQWAELLIERGDLRYRLGDAKWRDDWRAAINLRETLIDQLRSAHRWDLADSQIKTTCQANQQGENSLQAVAARLELDTAQLRNNYVFTLVKDIQKQRTDLLDEERLEDMVETARQNYLNIGRLSLLPRCLPTHDNPGDALCMDVVYPDTYALALMAAAQQQDPADRQNTSIRIEGLLQQSLDSVRNCPKKDDFLPIIRNHHKLARSMTL